jgi:hypothetical protein
MRLSRDTEVIKSSENSSNVSVYIEMAATSKEELDWCTELVIKAAEEQGLTLTPIKHNHMEAKTSTGPLGMDPLNIKYNMSSKAAGSTSFVFLNSDNEEKEDDE